MNQIDYSRFYHVTNADKTYTILLSETVLHVPTPFIAPLVAVPTDLNNFLLSPSYEASGNKLCYVSNQTSSILQQHLRESWSLWACLHSIFFYWFYYLITDAEKYQVYDYKFQENKWTCWGFYSLHHLAHVEFFSVMTRVSLMLFNYSFQAMILAAIYSTLGQNNSPYLGESLNLRFYQFFQQHSDLNFENIFRL